MYQARPSQMLGMEDEWAAYQLDAAAMTLAAYVAQARAEQRDVDALLDGKGDKSDAKKYRSTKGLARKTVKIPEGGVW